MHNELHFAVNNEAVKFEIRSQFEIVEAFSKMELILPCVKSTSNKKLNCAQNMNVVRKFYMCHEIEAISEYMEELLTISNFAAYLKKHAVSKVVVFTKSGNWKLIYSALHNSVVFEFLEYRQQG